MSDGNEIDLLMDGALELDQPIALEDMPGEREDIDMPGTNAADIPVMADGSAG
ncbi:hypothetical protein Pmar_PMAR005564, partial [Perkinsus marinus ATCC 50983]